MKNLFHLILTLKLQVNPKNKLTGELTLKTQYYQQAIGTELK